MMPQIGKILIIIGVIFLLLGALFVADGKIPLLGKLPGDFTIKGKNFIVYIPLATGLVLSILISVILNLIGRK